MTEAFNATDDVLMLSVRRGQTGLFAELFRRHSQAVFNYLRRMTGQYHRAQELTQDAFLSAFRARNTYEERGHFRAWLFCIATNLARTEMAKEKRRGEKTGNPVEPAHTHGPVQELEADERASAVRSALLRLSDQERAVVLLRHYHDMRFVEIARTLDVKEATVKSRMRYALAKLQRLLGPQLGRI